MTIFSPLYADDLHNMKLFYTLILMLFLISAYGQSAQDFADIGYSAMQKQDYKTGLSNFSKAIQANPQKAWFYHNRAVCYDALENYQSAITDFNTALSIEKTANSYNGLGITYTKLNNFNEAIKNFNLALSLDKNNVESHYNLGYAYGNLKKYQEAINNFNSAIKINPNHFNSLYGRAISLIELSRFNEALIDLNSLALIKPKDLEIIGYRAMCYYETQDYNNAIKDYSTLLSSDPNNISLLGHRAASYSFEDSYDKAIVDYTKILSIVKSGSSKYMIATTYYFRGKAYASKNDYKSSINDFTECIKYKPDDNTAYFYRATSKMQLDDKTGACADYIDAIMLGFKSSFDYKQIIESDPLYLDEYFKDCN
jgi:tetratricopeptide (TPR) repeat protein